MKFSTTASLLALVPGLAAAIATGPLYPRATPSLSSWGTAYPGLKWLRDALVETIFRSPPPPHTPKSATWSDVQTRFGDSVVLRFEVSTPEEEQALWDATNRFFLDVWDFRHGNVTVRLRGEEQYRGVMSVLPQSLQKPTVVFEDVVAKVWATYPDGKIGEGRVGGWERGGMGEWEEMVSRAAKSETTPGEGVDNIFFRNYQPLSVITSWLRLLEAMFPTHVELISLGKSFERRDILGVRLGTRDGQERKTSPGEKRKTVLVTGGVHAREWISTSTVNYLVWSLTTTYGKGPLITKFLQHFDVVLVPVLNPDGYEYSWTEDRLWRKSRQQVPWHICTGFDIDHAFGFEWDAVEHQTDPCSESFGGTKPFQAVEAARLARWAKNQTERNGARFVGLLDLHSYSQQILFPYAYSCDVDPANLENLEELAVGLAKAIRLSSGESYAVDSACEGAVARVHGASKSVPRVEAGGGSLIDWFYHEMGAHLSYQVKLRDTGSYGFLLPPEKIVPTGEEMYAALRYFADYLLGNNGMELLASNKEQTSHGAGSRVTGELSTELRRRSR